MILSIIARTGLFLAVVAWIVGQWWWCGMNYGGAMGVICLDTGWLVVVDPPLDDWRMIVLNEEQMQNAGRWYYSFFCPYPEGHLFSGFGMAVVSRANVLTIAIRHWLAISVFTVFSIALHIIYRIRPEVQPCEN